jgi:hypothetical protein
MRNILCRDTRRKRGFVLVILAVCLLVLIGMLGLATDLGRLYIAKNELQTFADAAAGAASQELDGTDEGIDRARQVAITYPNRWNFGSQVVAGATVTFSKSPDTGFVANPPSPPKDYKYVRVEAQGTLPLYFLSVFLGGQSQMAPAAYLMFFQLRTASVTADSAAGQFKVTQFVDNLLPYSPDAHLDPGRPPVTNPGFSEPDPFNFVIGKRYTMRWPPPGQRDKPGKWCEGDRDANFVSPDPSSERGFIDIGKVAGSGGSSYIRQAIISNVQTHPLAIGEPVVHVSGNRGTESDALRERTNQDTDSYSANWTEYQNNTTGSRRVGNGRRVVFMPVNNPFDGDRMVDFAAFLLPVDTEVCGTSNTAPCCAEYLGPGLLFGRTPATETAGVYRTRLLR